MIIKSYELNKLDLKLNKILLFHGNNEGLKNESIDFLVRNRNKAYVYEENEILENQKNFLEDLLSKSLFEEKKIIIIKRVSEKILNIVNEIISKKIDDIILIINSKNLEKKSKLRSYFEKEKNLVCVAFYPDNQQTLLQITSNFLKTKKIQISQSNINQIVNKCNGNRENLFNELKKIEFFSKNRKKITTENISKLINLSENHSISELIDNCLAKNSKKTIHILNENNFSNEDCILITRVFLNKAKKILKLTKEFEKNNNIDLTISSAKPPIFWKDKEITKKQIYNWKTNNIKNLIFKINDMELLLKKNLNNSINLITDFLLEQSSYKTNN